MAPRFVHKGLYIAQMVSLEKLPTVSKKHFLCNTCKMHAEGLCIWWCRSLVSTVYPLMHSSKRNFKKGILQVHTKVEIVVQRDRMEE